MNEDIPSYRVDPFSLGLDGARFDFGLPFEDRLRLMYGLDLASKTAGASYTLPYGVGNINAQYTTPNDARMSPMTNVQYISPAGLQAVYNDQGGNKYYGIQYNKRF
jgi:hypothetical protein